LISKMHRKLAHASRVSRNSRTAASARVSRCLANACMLGAAAFLLAGCTSGKQKIGVGAITFTDENGKPLAHDVYNLNAGQAIYADVELTNDTQLLGVDWTVNCSSAPPPGSPLPPGVTQDDSCGIFLPVHSASAPVPTYASSGAGVVTLFTAPGDPPKSGVVTLYAAATADHSRYSYVTLAIQGLPLSISFGSVPPTGMPENGTAPFKAVLTNDYAAGGANWSVACGAASCGSFSAPKTASGAVTTYTAPDSVPPGGTVIISATSVTDPTKAVSATVTIEPIQVSVTAQASTIEAGGSESVSATVTNDGSNSGVDWSLSCSTDDCGSIEAHTASGVAAIYGAPSTVPGSGAVTIRATSTANGTATGATVVTVLPVAGGSAVAASAPGGGETVRETIHSINQTGKAGNNPASPASVLSPLSIARISDRQGVPRK
jgi:hypothetical protein